MGTFNIIPTNIVKAYLAIRQKYYFKSFFSYVFLAIVFNAQNYIKTNKISLTELYEIVLSEKENSERDSSLPDYIILSEIVMRVMIMYFSYDSHMSFSEISRTVYSQRYHIRNLIEKNMRNGNPGFLTSKAIDVYFRTTNDEPINMAKELESETRLYSNNHPSKEETNNYPNSNEHSNVAEKSNTKKGSFEGLLFIKTTQVIDKLKARLLEVIKPSIEGLDENVILKEIIVIVDFLFTNYLVITHYKDKDVDEDVIPLNNQKILEYLIDYYRLAKKYRNEVIGRQMEKNTILYQLIRYQQIVKESNSLFNALTDEYKNRIRYIVINGKSNTFGLKCPEQDERIIPKLRNELWEEIGILVKEGEEYQA